MKVGKEQVGDSET